MATFLIYKPFGMLSQFTKEAAHHITLADLDFQFEKDVYPIGRLDADSEGLLLLSNDKTLNAQILNPINKQAKTYWAQVEGTPTEEALFAFKKGINITINGKPYKTLPGKASLLALETTLPERHAPIRIRQNIPDTWISISIIEGKNRQVRKMCAAIGFPVLRLIRTQLLSFQLGVGICQDLQPGMVIELNEELKIKD